MTIERGETEPLGNWLTRKWHHEHPDPVGEIESLTARVGDLEILVIDLSNTINAIADPDDYETGKEKTAETCRRLAAECVALNDL